MNLQSKPISDRLWEFRYFLRSHPILPRRAARAAKVFCIGLNKTGTTSIDSALRILGYRLGRQGKAEVLVQECLQGNYRRLERHCYSADAFQDMPFSLPGIYRFLDKAFPNAKFILTVRDSAAQWYRSLIRFHSKKWADGRRTPTREDLQNAVYIYKGRPWEINRLLYETPEEEPYHRGTLISHYERHIADVREHFRDSPQKLIEINVSQTEDYFRLCEFLGRAPRASSFPWENATRVVMRVNSDAA